MSTPHRVHLPAAPRKGLVMRVQPRDGSWGFNVTVQRVNGRSFYASVDGQSERHLIGQWSTWLRNLQKRGDILLNGVPAVVPGIQFNWTFTPSREELVTIRSRLKSALETTRTYQIRRSGTDEDLWTYAVVGGRRERGCACDRDERERAVNGGHVHSRAGGCEASNPRRGQTKSQIRWSKVS